MAQNDKLIQKYGGTKKVFLNELLGNDANKANKNLDFTDEPCITNVTKLSPYINENEIINTIKNNESQSTFLSLNIQSLNSKFDELRIFINFLKKKHNFEFSAICLQETWLSDNCCTDLFKLKNYHLYTQGYSCSKHGGLAIYVHNNYVAKNMNTLPISDIWEGQYMELSKINSNKKLSLYNIYRPPKNNTAKYDQFMNELTNNIKRFDSNKKPIIITGDFNINLLEINKKRAISRFFDSMISLSFLPKITLPTRLNETSASLIDNFYCKLNSDFKNESAGIVTINISDHLPYFFSFNFFDNKTTTPNLIKIKYKCFNSEEKLKQYLTENLNNFESDTNRDPNINYEKIDKTITEGIKNFTA